MLQFISFYTFIVFILFFKFLEYCSSFFFVCNNQYSLLSSISVQKSFNLLCITNASSVILSSKYYSGGKYGSFPKQLYLPKTSSTKDFLLLSDVKLFLINKRRNLILLQYTIWLINLSQNIDLTAYNIFYYFR